VTDSPPADTPALGALESGIGAATTLGLDTTGAETVLRQARERLGLVAEAYVVALVGGTGVGKSTLLNALGGAEVSPASARRPTTAAPVAWVGASIEADVRPILDRLGVGTTRTHRQADLGPVVVVDMPDLDSLELSHRAIVEELLPKVDVVAWVTDPEKYADAVLHDEFLRNWLPRLDRQVVVLNKADRLAADGAGTVTSDLRRVLRTDVPVLAVTAVDGADGVEPLRAWLVEEVEAKAVVRARIEAAARAELSALAGAAGVTQGVRDLVPEPVRRKATDYAISDIARLLDMETLEAQAVALARARARRRGTGPLGVLTSAIYRWSGRERRVADPAAACGDRGAA
jgi:energy-coupling factor transporter ATP-binding protein EcfA2